MRNLVRYLQFLSAISGSLAAPPTLSAASCLDNCPPISKRAQPGDKLEQTFTVKLMSHHCDPTKVSISLNTFDEHDDSSDISAGGQTFTTLHDYQNADGSQVKPSHGLCQFGEIPFTEIPTESRKFTITLVEEGHSQKMMDGTIDFKEDPKRDHLNWRLGEAFDFVEEGEPEFQDQEHFEILKMPGTDEVT